MADDMKSELLCPICLDLYKVPIILPCSHILCHECTSQLFNQNFVKCPVCRDRSYVTGGVDTLPRVITLENIIHRIHHGSLSEDASTRRRDDSGGSTDDDRDEASDATISCQMCDGKTPRRAKRSCQDCNASYCSDCLQISHPARPPFTDHRLIEPSLHPRPNDAVCTEHKEKGKVYCSDCKQLACIVCVELRVHENHQLLSLEQAFLMTKEVVTENLKKLDSVHISITDAVSRHQEQLTELQVSVETRRQKINRECDSLIREIENKRSYFIADLEYENRSKTNAIQDIQNEYKIHCTKVENLISYAYELLKEEDKGRFLQLSATVNDQLMKGTTVGEDFPVLPADVAQLKTKSVDFRKECVLLKDLSYLTAPSTPVIDVLKCSRSFDTVVLVIHNNDEKVAEVVNFYNVHYCTEHEKSMGDHTLAIFKMPQEERKSFRSMEKGNAMVLVITNLVNNTLYYFCVKAVNSAGESDTSNIVNCTTLETNDSSVPVPEIEKRFCRTYTSSIQIYCNTPSSSNPPSGVNFYLLYCEANVHSPRVWKSKPMSQYGIYEHRVFGLEPNTRYELMILATGSNGACQISGSIFLKTKDSA
ncbi:E3 ubiquitin-protein ligase Midline-1-like [Tubulanus polymorphus]|uniref:E3 ubiquitin-protein ligase Midline-1-like n=1 Tax=Tubulanus polymorphus TaxID=672921 RepID=UPI003DA44DCA